MNVEPGLIELHGYSRKIIRKDREFINFTFSDDNLGVLILKAHKNECPLYYNLKRNTKYHLIAKLHGKLRVNEDGSESTFNNVYVKEVLEGGVKNNRP